MKCNQQQGADGWWLCEACGVKTREQQDRECGPLDMKHRITPCRYLGQQTGERSCPTCSGNVRLKVFACSHAAHVETTLPECGACGDYSA